MLCAVLCSIASLLSDSLWCPWIVACQPGSCIHGVLQATHSRQLQWVAMPSSRGSSDPRIKLRSLSSPVLTGMFFTTNTIWEDPSQITNKWPLLLATYVSVGLCSDRQHIHSPWCSWLHGELPDTVGNSPLTSCFVPIPGLLILWGILPSPPALSPLQNCSQDLSFWVMVYLAGWHSLPSRPVSGGGETVPLPISPSCPSASMELPPCTGQGWSHLVNSRATVNQKHISVQKRNSSRIVQ